MPVHSSVHFFSTSTLNGLNILIHSTSIIKNFGTICFVPLRSWKVFKQFGLFHFDPDKFIRFLVCFILDPRIFWNMQTCFLFALESFGINFFDPLRSWRFWNHLIRFFFDLWIFGTNFFDPLRSWRFRNMSVCFFFDPKCFEINFFDPLWSWRFQNKMVRFFFAPKSFGIHFFDPLRSKTNWNKPVRFDLISKKSSDRSFVSSSFRYRCQC